MVQTYEPVFVSTPQEILAEAETFVVAGRKYVVEPDVTGKVRAGSNGKYWVRPNKGFAGREFVLDTFDGRRIVTRNLWMGEEVGDPDTAVFVGCAAPSPVRLVSHVWDRR